MKKPIMIHVLALFLISTLASCASCSSDLKESGKENGKEEKPDIEEVRPESFASDDEMLDYIQKVHLNYMWDGAEPTSGLARERIHLDGDYPEKDQNVVTTGGSGLAKGGSGDILAGLTAGLLAAGLKQGRTPEDAAVCAVCLHGAAADRCAKRRSMTAMLPGDLFEDLGWILGELGR